MDADFWRQRWRDGQLGWHQPAAHPMLIRHLTAFDLKDGARVFVPLCGKTLDIHWLLQAGFRVAGAELVESAIEELFAELGMKPEISDVGALRLYCAKNLEVFVGDLFGLDATTLGAVEAVYDRAALVALPAAVRPRYAAHLAEIAAGAPQLLITFDYDQARMEGPPFSVTEEEVRGLYRGSYNVEILESADVEGGLKGICPATERAWLLRATGSMERV